MIPGGVYPHFFCRLRVTHLGGNFQAQGGLGAQIPCVLHNATPDIFLLCFGPGELVAAQLSSFTGGTAAG